MADLEESNPLALFPRQLSASLRGEGAFSLTSGGGLDRMARLGTQMPASVGRLSENWTERGH